MSFRSPARVVGLLWWTILYLIHWQVCCKPVNRVLLHPTQFMWLLLEFDKVLCSLVAFVHAKSFNFGFCFADWIIGSEVGFEFLDEKIEIRNPCGFDGIQDGRFKTI